MPAHFENGEDVINVVVRFQIEEQRSEPEYVESRRRKRRTFQAMSGSFAQHDARRPRRGGHVIWHLIEETLDSGGRFQRPEFS